MVAAPCLDSRSALRSLFVLPRAMMSIRKLHWCMKGYKEAGMCEAGYPGSGNAVETIHRVVLDERLGS